MYITYCLSIVSLVCKLWCNWVDKRKNAASPACAFNASRFAHDQELKELLGTRRLPLALGTRQNVLLDTALYMWC